ncbi:MAG: MFS transporter [Anaerolineaceae bacterium]|nr:MFS transporter [Anaerolineaceae bacterium]
MNIEEAQTQPMQMTAKSYQLTTISCFVGIFCQAISSNITAILFIPLMTLYGLSYIHLGLLVGINFSTQVLVDIVASRLVDRFGFRVFVLPSDLLAVTGLVLFALSPVLFSNVLVGLILSTIIFSAACGLQEVMLSPIVNAIPHNEKGPAMALMHSFYAWGQVATIVITTLFLFFFGIRSWQIIVVLWAIVPLVNFFMFLAAPFPGVVHEKVRLTMRDLLLRPYYLVALLAILGGAATELVMNQWSSTFTEKVLDLPKVTGDLLGMAGFAVLLGLGRVIYGRYGNKMNMNNVLVASAGAAVICYIIVALSPVHAISLAACAVCGLAASLLWPGTLVITAERYPLAGAWIFAILAAAGDVGAAAGPFVAGLVTDFTRGFPAALDWAVAVGLSPDQFAIRAAILLAAIFPALTMACHWFLRGRQQVPDARIG